MVFNRVVRFKVVILGVLLMGLIGCTLGGRTAPSRFYLLSSLAASGSEPAAATGARPIAIGIGPVEISHYLDRPQIATRLSRNELSLSEFEKWAEPLQDNVTRVLAENLAVLLRAESVTIFPWRGSLLAVDYRVQIDVIHLDGVLGGDATLMARWLILEKDDRKVLLNRKSTFQEPTGAGDYKALVAAMSRTIASLSEEIAEDIKSLISTDIVK
ncbi:PqiC family protein [bacterium]|nr:PqiC family protein [bacterium]